MPLQAGSSAIYWEQAGVDSEDGIPEPQEEVKEARKKGPANHRKRDSQHLHRGDSGYAQPEASTSKLPDRSIALVNKEQEDATDDEEEYTCNPDAELRDAQADRHQAFEGAQHYEAMKFGDINKFNANKRRKLVVQQEATLQNLKEEDRTDTLKDLRIYVNGETEPPQYVLRDLIVLHGGRFIHNLDGTKTKATHIIASNLTPSKRIGFKEYKVVTSEWLMESIHLRKIQDWRNYREDQVENRAGDVGVAPAGTHIAQPRLAFAKPPQARPDYSTNKLPTVNREMEQELMSEEEEEFTYNPDAELEDIQADKHKAYEGAQQYESIKFGEFGKYMANKRRKLVVQQDATLENAKDGEKTDTLKDLRIYINGETEPPQHVLSKLIVLHGGRYIPYLDGTKTKASHIVASNLTPSKRIALKEYKVVTSAWVMDSIRLRKVQDWRNYREDQAAVRASDIGTAPAGTQIAQPRLAFAKPAQAREEYSSTPIAPDTTSPGPGMTKAQPPSSRPNLPQIKGHSPRRLPPPTSDPLTLLHVEGAAQAAAGPSNANPEPQPPWVAQGWYNHKPNERSAQLLKDESWRLQETAVNTTEFLTKYYKESRLHWLSTWKAELKKMVSELSEGKEVDISDQLDKKKKGSLKGTEEDGRVVLHVDFDSFFVAVSLLDRPHLKGQPVVVCHASQGDVSSSSEIASASYEAREFGIKNGMSLGSARGRCPQLQTVPYEFELYRSISAKFYQILFSHAHELEAVSIDEAYISLPSVTPARTGSQLLEAAEAIRSEIREATGCNTSIGVSHNKLLARLATNRAKPSSSFQIGNGVDPTGASLKAFLKEVDLESLPGIGWKRANEVEEKLSALAARLKSSHFIAKQQPQDKGKGREVEEAGEAPFSKVGELLPFQKNQLKEALGEKTGEMLYNYARGLDNRELEMENVRKSVSAEVNYGIRFRTPDEVEVFCMGLGEEVAKRLQKLGYRSRQLTLKVMRRATHAPIEPPKFLGHGVCDTFNSSKVVELTDDIPYIGRTCWELMRALACPPEELRGIGLQMQKLENVKEGALAGANSTEGQSRLVFKAVQRQPAREEANQLKEAPKLPPNNPIVISTNTSSSPQIITAPPRELPTRAGRSLRSRSSISYIDLSSEPENEAEDDFKLLSQAPANFVNKPKAVQTILGGQITKRGKSSSAKPEPILITATSPAAGLTSKELPALLPSPTRLTDKQLSLLGVDAIVFRSFGRAGQSQILKECLIAKGESKEVQELLKQAGVKAKKGKKARPSWAPVFEEAAANVAKREETRKREQEKADKAARGPIYIKLVGSLQTAKKPTFAGKSDTDGIRKVLKEWMEGVGMDHGPALEEMESFAKFCLGSVSRDPKENGGQGQDVAKISAVLDWWQYLIDGRDQRAREGSQRLAVNAWRDAWQDVRGRVAKAIEQSLGAPLPVVR